MLFRRLQYPSILLCAATSSSHSSQQQQEYSFFTAADMQLLPYTPDSFIVRGCPYLSSATVPHSKFFKSRNGKFSTFLKDPETEKTFAGWVFNKEEEQSMKQWLKSLEETSSGGAEEGNNNNDDGHAGGIPEDFERLVSPNGVLEVLRLNQRWLVIRGVKDSNATRLYMNDIKKELHGGFCRQCQIQKNDGVVDNNHDDNNKSFSGWVIPAQNRKRVQDWIKTLTAPPRLSSNFRTYTSHQKEEIDDRDKNVAEEEDWCPQ